MTKREIEQRAATAYYNMINSCAPDNDAEFNYFLGVLLNKISADLRKFLVEDLEED